MNEHGRVVRYIVFKPRRSIRPLHPTFDNQYKLVFLTSLAKEVMFFGSIGLSVCLFVDNVTQKLMNGLG